jgi:hypothetical protein
VKTKVELIAELGGPRQKRRPPISADEQTALDETARLQAELDAEYRALRLEENEDIRAQYCPDASFAFVDFDAANAHSATMEHNGRTCTVHTRFVVKAANGDVVRDMQNDAVAKQAGQPVEDQYDKLVKVVYACIEYPKPVKGQGSAQHYLDLQASFFKIGGIVPTLANEALRLGGMAVAAHQAKS